MRSRQFILALLLVAPLAVAQNIERQSQLLQSLKHDRIIAYELIYETSEEKYLHLAQRRENFNELVHNVLEHNDFSEQLRKLIDGYIQQSDAHVQDAFRMKALNEHWQASQLLEKSVMNLTTTLKFPGVKI